MNRADAAAGARVSLFIAALTVVLSASSGLPVLAQREPQPASLDLVVLDVAVSDDKGIPVADLKAADFRIKEDGKPMDIKTFAYVDSHDPGPAGDGRTVALLLDDTGVAVLGSSAIQQLSRAVLSLARRGDEISVVRLHKTTDEAYGDLTEAQARIDGYRGGVQPFVLSQTQADALNRIASMADQLAITDGRRKAIVCIGTQLVCDVPEPGNDSRQEVWTAWRRAVTSAARANVAVYVIIPGRVRLRGGGIADATGGLTYASFSDFQEPILTLWKDSGAHYLLGYWPATRNRELHSVNVSVARPKVHVRSRHLRGE